MTTSEVERRLTAVLHQHAEEAMNQTDTISELSKLHERVDHSNRGRSRHRAATAAALSAAAVAVAALWFGLAQDDSPAPVNPVPPAASPSPSSSVSEAPEAPQTPGSTVTGFEGVESFPMTYVVPNGFSDPSTESGTRGYSIEDTSGGAAAFLVSTLTDAPTSDLPDDVAAHIRATRDELMVSNVSTTEVGGRPAQSFTLAQRPGTAPDNLFCVRTGSCYKLLEDKPMDVTAVRTERGLVLFWVEYEPQDRARVQGPMQAWFSSVRWK